MAAPSGFALTDTDLKKFFPANEDGFIKKAGAVACVTQQDLEDEHKRRHLESFRKSMSDWKAYEGREEIVEDSAKEFARHLLRSSLIKSEAELELAIRRVRKILKCNPNKAQLGAAVELVRAEFEPTVETRRKYEYLDKLLLRRAVRTSSGVAVITVLTSPGSFSCPHDCWYCPNEPGQPRSYLSTEPAVLRGNQCHWDAAVQFWDRARTLHRNRHTVDKVEILVLGGTWSGYSSDYQNDFCRDLFYAANEFNNLMTVINYDAVDSYPPEELLKNVRQRLSLEEEQILNEVAPVKVIGLTLETRPDYITTAEIQKFRMYGCTRVQLGVQHVDNVVLAGVNRGHSIHDVRKALHLLKSSGYKVDIHLMPDLPNSSPILDQYMFDQVLRDSSLQADQWKIYPCEVTPFTKISEWYKYGIYFPYTEMKSYKPEGPESEDIFDCETTGEEVLIGLILQVKKCMHPWIRLNRVIRDIPNQSIIAGNSKTNLRQLLESIAKAHGWTCPCMRCREIRKNDWNSQDAELVVRAYSDVDAIEYFLSFENQSRSTIYGFLRLRVPNFLARNTHSQVLSDCTAVELNPSTAAPPMSAGGVNELARDIQDYSCSEDDLPFACLRGRAALIRELHVYGVLVGTEERAVDSSDGVDNRTQHVGVGTALMCAAETLACCKGAERVVIIAGVGTRNYYRRFNYELHETYMVKDVKGDQAKAAIFDKWAIKSNQLIRGSECMKIEHIYLDELPSLRSVKIDPKIIREILEGRKVNSGAATVSYRAFLSHWVEVISIPKMTSNQEIVPRVELQVTNADAATGSADFDKENLVEKGEGSALADVDDPSGDVRSDNLGTDSEPVLALSVGSRDCATGIIASAVTPAVVTTHVDQAPHAIVDAKVQHSAEAEREDSRRWASRLKDRQESDDRNPQDQPDLFAAQNTGGNSFLDGWNLDSSTVGALSIAGLSLALGIYFGRRLAH